MPSRQMLSSRLGRYPLNGVNHNLPFRFLSRTLDPRKIGRRQLFASRMAPGQRFVESLKFCKAYTCAASSAGCFVHTSTAHRHALPWKVPASRLLDAQQDTSATAYRAASNLRCARLRAIALVSSHGDITGPRIHMDVQHSIIILKLYNSLHRRDRLYLYDMPVSIKPSDQG